MYIDSGHISYTRMIDDGIPAAEKNAGIGHLLSPVAHFYDGLVVFPRLIS